MRVVDGGWVGLDFTHQSCVWVSKGLKYDVKML